MPGILTPTTLWNNFDDSAELGSEKLSEKTVDGIRYESVSFYGRETGEGRVKAFGVFASNAETPSAETVLIFPDSAESVDEDILKLFVERGYSAFMVDYRGEWEGVENKTVYPENISYANTVKCGRFKDFVDETADKTTWYEWTALGIFARKYIIERTGNEDIAVVGIRDGGEIAWKLAVARKFSCIVSVCAAGWLAYSGISKFQSDEQSLDSERYRFIAGIDSQAYAPYVKCPVMLLCSTNDSRLDYDRAYDTFSRINQDFASESVIVYSVRCDSSISMESTTDMFMYLDKYLKNRQVFIPQPVEVNVSVDEEQNLIAVAKFDGEGEVEATGMFFAEDCIDPSIRDWTVCGEEEKISDNERKFYLDIYEETGTIFVLCYATYTNGFTVWSKMAVKKISGRFKNTQGKCRVMYTSKNGTDGVYVAEPRSLAVGGIFFTDSVMMPQIVTKAKGIDGIYSVRGLTTYRLNSPRYAPKKDNLLKIDVFSDETSEITFTIEDAAARETYKYSQSILGGVWQSLIIESKLFKTVNGVQLSDYAHNLRFCITCDGNYAVNNIMWL
ncbi:MAG: S9 family peptidase [Ruminococcus flavefaciens]|nr:S9 family peptidase [Ruminococcus flavefaciens]